MRLLYEASEIIPDDPYLVEYVKNIGIPVSLDSDPPGATVYVKGYNHPEREWIRLGETPLENAVVALPARFRVEKEGYVTFEGAPFGVRQDLPAVSGGRDPARDGPRGGRQRRVRRGEPVELDEFWIDKYEVTNREYKAFVDDGGYRDDRFWAAEVDRSAFVDTTGTPRSGRLGARQLPRRRGRPAGRRRELVRGVGLRGVGRQEPADRLPLAARGAAEHLQRDPAVEQLRHQGARPGRQLRRARARTARTTWPATSGSGASIGPATRATSWAARGRIRTTCIAAPMRPTPTTAWRSTASAACRPPSRRRMPRWSRSSTSVYDHRQDTAIDDDVFALVRQDFDYDDRELDTQVESTDDGPEHWRHEVVSVRSAYGDERLPIHLYLPKNVEPPYQARRLLPAVERAVISRTALTPASRSPTSSPRAGARWSIPIYQGTYERQVDRRRPQRRPRPDDPDRQGPAANDRLPRDPRGHRQRQAGLLRAELGRRDGSGDDRDRAPLRGERARGGRVAASPGRLAAGRGAAELRAALDRADGDDQRAKAISAPRSRPTSSRCSTCWERPTEHKRLVLLDGGHVPASPNEVIREVLDWLDLYLGPVEGGG